MKTSIFVRLAAFLICTLMAAACTQQQPNSFRFLQQEETFPITQKFNTKVDILYVLDNSASMNVSQDRLRRGFASFAAKYLRPSWDMRVAVITTDAYMANPAFKEYLGTRISGTDNWASPYIQSRLSTFENPVWNRNLVDLQTGTFKNGFIWNDQMPTMGPDYARLLPGIHDGPVVSLCTEKNAYFFLGASQCRIRDDQTRYQGPDHCLNPGDGESAITQCTNTVENDSIHSGHPILSTQSGSATLVPDFMINASVGTSGIGSERGLGSVMQFLSDNETGDTAFFRKDSQRVLVFLTDEDDQSLVIPASVPRGFTPYTNYLSSCPERTVDGYSYRLSKCPDPSALIPVSEVKGRLDGFFAGLDGTATTSSYFVIPIVPLSGKSIQQLQQQRSVEDAIVGNPGDVAVDRGDRYIDLANQVGNGSRSLDIADEDYGAILDQVGRAIVTRKSEFTLARAPTGTEDMIVTIVHADGTRTLVSPDEYTVNDKTFQFTDLDFVLGLSETDWIIVSYQPTTLL